MDRTFCDIHMHAMDLSHPNVLAFTRRIKTVIPKLLFSGDAEMFLHASKKNLFNLLTVMENSIEDYFILMEYFLKNKDPRPTAGGAIKDRDAGVRHHPLNPLDRGLRPQADQDQYLLQHGPGEAGRRADGRYPQRHQKIQPLQIRPQARERSGGDDGSPQLHAPFRDLPVPGDQYAAL